MFVLKSQKRIKKEKLYLKGFSSHKQEAMTGFEVIHVNN
jgi:hypothetical protein